MSLGWLMVLAGVLLLATVVSVSTVIGAKVRRRTSTSKTAATPSAPRRTSRPWKKGNFYRTKDGKADYRFDFAMIADCYRIYIVTQPSYGARSDGMHESHRQRDSRGFYVCRAGSLRTEAEARLIAALWADKTQEYIRSGRTF